MFLNLSLHLAGLKEMLLFFQVQNVYGCIHSAYHAAWHSRYSINIYWLKKIPLNGSFCFKVYYWKKWAGRENLFKYNTICNHRLLSSLQIGIHGARFHPDVPIELNQYFFSLLGVVVANDSKLSPTMELTLDWKKWRCLKLHSFSAWV
jgi:hypothetical protein